MVDKTKQILKGAVATHLGWVDPKTGELLVSIRGLSNAVTWTRKDGLDALKKDQDVPKEPEVSETEKAIKFVEETFSDKKVVSEDKKEEKKPTKGKNTSKAKKTAE